MAANYVLYNPLAGNGTAQEAALALEGMLEGELLYFDITHITNYAAFFGGMEPDARLVIVGGDGTLNRFANDAAELELPREVLYLPVGTGNDFARELTDRGLEQPFPVTELLEGLPSVQIGGQKHRFINGIGFGIDGYCCQVGDELRRRQTKKVNYTAIAIKGLLYGFQSRNAKVTVDGAEYTYENVWIAPTMYGKYYGGGMIPAPMQDRCAPEGILTLVLFYGKSRLRTLCAFPGIFKGTHVRHQSMVAVHSGHEIRVEFDRPTPLQVDGETFLNISGYTAVSASAAKTFAPQAAQK